MATYQIPAPEPMNCNGDVANNWKSFHEAYEYYLIATERQESLGGHVEKSNGN